MSTGPRFRFGLERVRELRAHDEDRAKEAFAASLAQRMRGAALLASASQQHDEALQARRASDASSGAELISMQAYLDRVEQSRIDAERQLEQSEATVADRRSEMTEASRRRQALERLKERRAAEHAATEARREGVVLDEIAAAAHRRRLMNTPNFPGEAA